MGEKLLTIEDIAQAANVAKSTVSRVLNNSGYVGKETRKRVEKVIAESNYTPWVTARNLSKQMSNTIGVVVSEITNPYFARAFEGISEVIDKNDMNIIFCNTDRTPYKEEQALRMLREKRVRGIIISPVIDYDVPEKAKLFRSQLESISAPTVLLDAPVDLDLWDGVFFDNFDGAYHAVKAMISSGHRQIGIITGDRKNKVVNHIYVYNYDCNQGILTEKQCVSTLPEKFSGTSYAAELIVSKDGRFLYACNRGHDSIVAFSIDETGKLHAPDFWPCGGKGPRHICFGPEEHTIFVANKESNQISIMERNEQTGAIGNVLATADVPAPACVVMI